MKKVLSIDAVGCRGNGGDSHIRLGGIDYLHILDYTKIPERMAFLLE